jgi:hypothetical protein
LKRAFEWYTIHYFVINGLLIEIPDVGRIFAAAVGFLTTSLTGAICQKKSPNEAYYTPNR